MPKLLEIFLQNYRKLSEPSRVSELLSVQLILTSFYVDIFRIFLFLLFFAEKKNNSPQAIFRVPLAK